MYDYGADEISMAAVPIATNYAKMCEAWPKAICPYVSVCRWEHLPFRERFDIIRGIHYLLGDNKMNLFRRKVYDKLKNWKILSNGRTAVMIDGARRVGKTCLVQCCA